MMTPRKGYGRARLHKRIRPAAPRRTILEAVAEHGAEPLTTRQLAARIYGVETPTEAQRVATSRAMNGLIRAGLVTGAKVWPGLAAVRCPYTPAEREARQRAIEAWIAKRGAGS